MPVVGLDLNDAPDVIERVDSRIWFDVIARTYTHWRAEPYRPNFGLGLIDALLNEQLNRAELRRRLERSFSTLQNSDLVEVDVSVAGDAVFLDVTIDGTRIDV